MSKIQTPEFCFIAPVNYLQYTTESSTHLTLAHLVDQDDIYASFYDIRARLGDYIIMDNSAYELKIPYDTTKLVELGHKCGASAIVLPDYPFQQSSVTINAAIDHMKDFKEEGFDTFFVPQSKVGDLDDWISAYVWAAENPLIDIIGMSILGIPNSLPHIHPAYSRVVMSQILLERSLFNKDKHHHYLGLNSGPALEIPSLLRMGTLDSIDSSGPIWSAILGHAYTTDADSYQQVSKLKMPVNFYQPATKDEDTVNRIRTNIMLTNSLFDMETGLKTWYAEE
jgi:hypothetical protein